MITLLDPAVGQGVGSAPSQLTRAHPAAPPGAAAGPEILSVEKDTAWSGEVRVHGVVHVRKAATLSILPGTRVLFARKSFPPPDAHEGFVAPGIRVEGRIVAVWTEEAPIRFTGEGPPSPASWDKILFTFSEGNRFEHCVFLTKCYELCA